MELQWHNILHLSPPTLKVKNIRKSTKEALHIKSLSPKINSKIVGRMQHSAIVISARKGIFQLLNMDLLKSPRTINIIPASYLTLILEYWLTLLSDISQQPTIIYKLVLGNPQYIGFTDSSSLGVGGVWMSVTYHVPPIVWSIIFPE